jgi:hypothetical protein
MKSLKNKFRLTVVAMAAVGMIVPQTAWAGGHGGGGHSSGHSSGGSSGNSQPRVHHQPPASGVIPAPNGNTGISGIGLPKPLDASKGHSNGHDSKNLSLGGGVELPNHVKSAPNGNTGITGIGRPQGSSKTPASFVGSDAGQLGILSSMAGGASQKATNAGIIIIGGKSDALKFAPIGGHHNDFPAGLSPSSPLLRTADKGGLGILGNANHAANDAELTVGPPKSHKNSNSGGDANGTGAERITKIEANAPYRSNVRPPNYSPTKVTVGPSTSPIKPLVDQEVKTGPKLPGEAGVLGKGVLSTPANSATRVAPMKRTTHTAGFDLGPFDPTGGVINAGLEAGQAWLAGGSGGGAASAGGGGAAGGDVIAGYVADGSGGSGYGGIASNALAAATQAAANAAKAAQTAASATTGTGLLLGSSGGVPALGLSLAGAESISEYERGTVGYDGLLTRAGGRNRPGGYYQNDAPKKSVDGPIGKKRQALSGGPGSFADIAKGAAEQGNQAQAQIKVATVASSATNVAQAARKIDTMPNQTLPAGPIVDANKNPTTPATNSNRGSRLGSLIQNLSGGAGGSESPGAGGSEGGGAAPAIPATTDLAAPPTATDAAITPPVADGADLVLENIELAAPATLVAGPAYRVKFRNQGTAVAGKFEVAVVAGLDGKLTADAPRAVVEVNSLAAGQSGEVTLRLPQSALKMTGAVDGKPAVFTHLFVAVDLMNTVAETDETNNTAVVERAAVDAVATN